MRIVLPAFLLLAAALAGGCASSQSGTPLSSTRGSTLVRSALVVEIRDVVVQGNQHAGAGAVLGGVLGAIAGNTVGSGFGRVLATSGGALIGGAAGQQAGRAASRSNLVRLTLRTANGNLETHDVGANEPFHVGDEVRIITDNDGTRVVRQ